MCFENKEYLDAAGKAAAGVYNSLNNNIIIPASGKEGKIALNKGTNKAFVKTKTVTTKAADQLKGPAKRVITVLFDIMFDVMADSVKPSGPKPPVTSPAERAAWELQKKAHDELKRKKPSVRKIVNKRVQNFYPKSSKLRMPLGDMLGLLDVQSNYNISTLLDLKKTKVLTLDKDKNVAKFTLEDYLKITDFASVKGRKSKKQPKPSDLQSKKSLAMLFSFPDKGDVNLDNFTEKTSPKLRQELIKLANAVREVFGPKATIAVTEAKKTSGHVGS